MKDKEPRIFISLEDIKEGMNELDINIDSIENKYQKEYKKHNFKSNQWEDRIKFRKIYYFNINFKVLMYNRLLDQFKVLVNINNFNWENVKEDYEILNNNTIKYNKYLSDKIPY